jgi:hypothetical protein
VARARALNTDPVGLPCFVVDCCGELIVGDQCDIRRIMSAFDGGKLAMVVAMVQRDTYITLSHCSRGRVIPGPTMLHMIIDTGGPNR